MNMNLYMETFFISVFPYCSNFDFVSTGFLTGEWIG